ncbi:MAG: polyphosphate kinase 2 family protein [Pirellulaceae bacterium]
MLDTKPYRVAPGSAVDLRERSTRDDGGFGKKEGKKAVKKLSKRLIELQELLYARQARGLLVIFQAMDAGGKDSTTRRVFRKLNPAGVRVKSFKSPSQRERLHDFLWRIHQHTPRRGYIAIFNRSQYEDVVAVRVRQLAPPEAWQGRFEHINAFERLLADGGTIVLKFFLHISKDYQKERLQRRLDRPDKHWKFDPGDLDDRRRWDQFTEAYSEAIQRCSTDHAPWYVVPAERRWFRDLVVMQTIVDKLQSLRMSYPEPDFNPATIEIP